MSYEVASGNKSLGQFASNKGYSDFIAAVRRGIYPALKRLVNSGQSDNVDAVREELSALATVVSDRDVAASARELAGLIKGQKKIVISDGLV